MLVAWFGDGFEIPHKKLRLLPRNETRLNCALTPTKHHWIKQVFTELSLEFDTRLLKFLKCDQATGTSRA